MRAGRWVSGLVCLLLTGGGCHRAGLSPLDPSAPGDLSAPAEVGDASVPLNPAELAYCVQGWPPACRPGFTPSIYAGPCPEEGTGVLCIPLPVVPCESGRCAFCWPTGEQRCRTLSIPALPAATEAAAKDVCAGINGAPCDEIANLTLGGCTLSGYVPAQPGESAPGAAAAACTAHQAASFVLVYATSCPRLWPAGSVLRCADGSPLGRWAP